MKKFSWLLLGSVSLFVGSACQAQQPAYKPDYRLTATVKDIMEAMVDPAADVLWDSVATIVTVKGTEERAPKTDQEWAAVRHNAIMLVEATNLIQIPGREVAKPGEQSENPKVELQPEEIAILIGQDRQAWTALSNGLHEAAAEALKAIDSKNVQGLMNAGEKIDTACETCHLKYWYPISKQAAAQTKPKA